MTANLTEEIHWDLFAGGGGASEGYEIATGRPVAIAVNHDPEAIAMHRANHPRTKHYEESVWGVDPLLAVAGRKVSTGWLSPDCKHFSKAKGAALVDKRVRSLAWIARKWCGRGGRRTHVAPGRSLIKAGPACPRVLFLENVEEFKTWGPLIADRCPQTGRVVRRDGTVAAKGERVSYHEQRLVPDPKRAGVTYLAWCASMDRLGATAREASEVRACDLGAPTIRKRLYGVIRFDGGRVVWPEASHATAKSEDVAAGRRKPHEIAADRIDWSVPCPSIFLTKPQARKVGCIRPLARATQKRLAKGVERFVMTAAEPFFVTLTHHGNAGVDSINLPHRTITAANRGEQALAVPLFAGCGGRAGQSRPRGGAEPYSTITSKGDACVVMPLVTRAQHGGGVRPANTPAHTITASPKDQNQVMAAYLAQQNTGMVGHDARKPASTIVGKGASQALVVAHTMKYYSTEQAPELREPHHTITTKDRFALIEAAVDLPPWSDEIAEKARRVARWLRRHGVKVEGEFAMCGEFVIYDIGLRMFLPRELFLLQGFRASYIIEHGVFEDKETGELYQERLTKTAQVRMCGNSVCPDVAAALIAANCPELCRDYIAAA